MRLGSRSAHLSNRAAIEKRRHVRVKSRSALGVIPRIGRSANLPRTPNNSVINAAKKNNQLNMVIMPLDPPS